jgi:glycosyltransferase involved in cell wall biosynthesis
VPKTHNEKLIIIPAWNEEECIVGTLKSLVDAVNSKVLVGYDILVANDGSSDQTSKLVHEFACEFSGDIQKISVVDMPFNMGQGAALQTGFKFALSNDYNFAVTFDGDGQHSPNSIPKIMQPVLENEVDICVGSRFLGVGDYKMKGLRKIASLFITSAIGFVCKAKLTDGTSGFAAVNRTVLRIYSQYFPKEYLGDCVDARINAAKNGARIGEVGVQMLPRQGGTPSNNHLKSAVYLLRSFVMLIFALTRRGF